MLPRACLLLGLAAAPAQAASPDPVWLLSGSAGSTARAGDRTRAFGSVALSRKLGRAYVRATVTRFASAIRQVDATLPSTYTLGSLSAGATLGRWFVDGYATLGRQDYRGIETGHGRRPAQGAAHSPVYGAGLDGGYVAWLSPRLSLTPVLSLQYVHARALRGRFDPDGFGTYETTEAGATGSASLRVDRWFGWDRQHDLGVHVGRAVTSNLAAALASGPRGIAGPTTPEGGQRDGWTEFGANAGFRLRPGLYLDLAGSRTCGARSGDATTLSTGLRLLF